jgi:hypothetical protein
VGGAAQKSGQVRVGDVLSEVLDTKKSSGDVRKLAMGFSFPL